MYSFLYTAYVVAIFIVCIKGAYCLDNKPTTMLPVFDDLQTATLEPPPAPQASFHLSPSPVMLTIVEDILATSEMV